ncbi:MAG: AAA family ATPase [Nannocystaceae bacterium]
MDASSIPPVTVALLHASATWRLERWTAPDHALLVRRPVIEGPARLGELEHEVAIAAMAPGAAILRPHGLLQRDDGFALAYDDVAGVFLSSRTGSSLAPGEARSLARALVRALASLHRAGIVHRNLHPGAVLLAADGTVRLTELTIASVGPAAALGPGLRGPRELAYVAPEETGRMGRSGDHRGDLYSVGVILYELLAGAPPFVRGDPLELVHAHMTEAPPPIRGLLDDPEDDDARAMAAVLERLLAKEPDDRYDDADAVLAALDEPAGGERAPRFRAPERLYGREAAEAALTSAFARVDDGRCVLALIAGGAGIGKSSLVDAVFRPLRAHRALFAAGKFDPLRRSPFTAVIDAARSLVRHVLTLDARQVAVWRERLRYALGASLPVLGELVPDVAALLGEQEPPPPMPAADAQRRVHLTLQRFLHAFARAERPLVLFLDDLQWADEASLHLLEGLIDEPASLLVIGATRTDEAGRPPPRLLALIDGARRAGGAPVEIALAPLDEGALRQLLRDAFGVAEVDGLIDDLLRRTHGNPLFVRELLRFLERTRRLRFDGAAGRWSLGALDGRDLPESVAALLSGELERLPPATRALLHDAACLGDRVDADDLVAVHGCALDELWALLEPALALDLVLVDDRDAGPGARLRFLHDRVRQAAYEGVPLEARPARSARLGRRLLARARARGPAGELQGDDLFAVVDHLNAGAGLLDEDERRELVALDLAAARAAKGSASYEVARHLLEAASELVGERWGAFPEAFEVHAEIAECEHLAGDAERARQRLRDLGPRAQGLLERLRLADLRVNLEVSLGDTEAALRAGREGLAAAGLTLADDPASCRAAVADELARIEAQLAETPLAARVDAAAVADPETRAVLTLLADLLAPANMTRPDLYALINTTQIRLSIEHGHTDVSAYTYTVYGYFLATAMGRYAQAEEFGRFGVDLNEALGNRALRCRIRFVFATYAHFIRPLREVLRELEVAVAEGRDSGDHIYLSSACSHVLIVRLAVGDPLEGVAAEAERLLELMKRTRVASSIAAQRVARQLAAALRGATLAPGSLADGVFDEDEFIAACERNGRTFALRWYATASLLLAVIFGRRDQARRLLERFGPAIQGNYAFYFATEFAALACLALVDLAAEADPADPAALVELDAYREAVDGWARACPANYGALAALIAADLASLRGDDAAAVAGYDAAITGASAQGLVAFEAIAHERAAGHHERRGQASLARALRRGARDAYARWGATRKVADLDLLLGGPAPTPTPTPSEGRLVDLDLRSAIQASQALASALSLDELLQAVIRIAALTASATRALLVLDDEGQRLRVAAVSVAQGPTPSADALDLDAGDAPAAPIRLALRTLQPIALDDPEHRGLREQDPYLARARPRSALCVPLIFQARAYGVLYLENLAAAGVFSATRREALGILCTQLAISLGHTRLYQSLVEARARAEAASQAKSTFLANMSHELRTPLTAILGYAELIAEEMEDQGEATHLGDLERIRRAGLHLLGVIGDILDLSKIEADRLEIVVEAFELAELLDTVVEAMKPAIQRGGNALVYTPPAGLGTMRSDRLRLRQILLNLLGNAAKFTEAGVITLAVTRAGERVRFTVVDTGIGMAADQVERVFDAFHQVDDSTTRTTDGTGLGLTISRRLSQLLGGEISVESAPGEGSRFTVDLPLDLAHRRRDPSLRS